MMGHRVWVALSHAGVLRGAQNPIGTESAAHWDPNHL